jgi:RuvB-like protein 1 (pontin 52)
MGEVVEISPEKNNSLFQEGYSKTSCSATVGLKTVSETKQLKLDASIYQAFQKERIQLGDVIQIEANRGIITRLGKCDSYESEFDLEAETYVPLPYGSVGTKREIFQEMTLNDLDLATLQPKTEQNLHPMISNLIKSKKNRSNR